MAVHKLQRYLQEYYINRLRATVSRRDEALKSIKTPAQARKYRNAAKKAIRRIFYSRFPAEKSALRPKTKKTTDFGDFLVEHVIYNSRPNFSVTANLYLPKNLAGKAPAVILTCGHSAIGKAEPAYAKACVRLVREGYVVLIYDPINQGEREIYSLLPKWGRKLAGSPCLGHNILGKQLGALGDWFGAWRAWDGIRGIDYLLSRPEVNGKHLGVTGNSGGGTLSAYLWALDDRITMVASSCWATSYLNDIENGMPADNEQYPPGLLAAGLDKMDFFIARAGEPTLLLGQKQDFFDERGLRKGFGELRKVHKLAKGDPDACRLFFDSGTHGFTDALQLEMLKFFNSMSGKPLPVKDRPIDVPDKETLAVTPKLDINRAGSRPPYVLLAKTAEKLKRKRGRVSSKELVNLVKKVLKVRVPGKKPYYRKMFHTTEWLVKPNRKVVRFLVETDPGVLCPLRRVCREGSTFSLDVSEKVFLYLPNIDGAKELSRRFPLPGVKDYWLFDVRGLGEGLLSPEDVFLPYGNDYMMNGHALMYGETLLGDRVRDVLSVLKLLRSEGAREIHLLGRGQGAVTALIAALLDKKITGLREYDAPKSIHHLVTTPVNDWPDVNFPHGILEHFDLPDIRKALGPGMLETNYGEAARFETRRPKKKMFRR